MERMPRDASISRYVTWPSSNIGRAQHQCSLAQQPILYALLEIRQWAKYGHDWIMCITDIQEVFNLTDAQGLW